MESTVIIDYDNYYHDWRKISTIIVTLILYTFTVILNALNSIGNVKRMKYFFFINLIFI
jgi:hypothetical protein